MSSQVEGLAAPGQSSFSKLNSKELKKEKCVSFSPYARCLKLEPQNLTDEEKGRLWWQKSDYEDSARVRNILSKEILDECGSGVWFRSKCAPSCSPSTTSYGVKKFNNNTKDATTTSKDGAMVGSSSSSTGANAPLHLCDHESESKSQEFYEMQGKWWHEFGHSRRGLEHIVSVSEGQERHLNARSVIRSVLEEQKRQNIFLPKGYFDADKVRSVSLKQTQWARLLARASGESDADALKANFNELRRKPREYYLKEHFDNNSKYAAMNNDLDMPNFMRTLSSPTRPTKESNLSPNTFSQICLRRSRVISVKRKLKCDDKRKKSKATGKKKMSIKSAFQESSITFEEKGNDDTAVENNDDDASTSTEDSSRSSLAKMAAGWGGDESLPQEDMSSVYIDMGIIGTPKMTVG